MYKKIFLTLATVSTTGCVSAIPYTGLEKSTEILDTPPINSINTVSLGEAMLTQGKVTVETYLLLEENITGKVWHLKSGEYQGLGTDQKSIHFNSSNKVFNSFGGLPPASISISKQKTPEICVNVPLAKTHCYPAKYKLIKKESVTDESFQQTLIYNGKIKNKINIMYKESSNNYARPAFDNQVEYDLSDSKTIGYKNALIEVIEANNRQIKYKLIKGFR